MVVYQISFYLGLCFVSNNIRRCNCENTGFSGKRCELDCSKHCGCVCCSHNKSKIFCCCKQTNAMESLTCKNFEKINSTVFPIISSLLTFFLIILFYLGIRITQFRNRYMLYKLNSLTVGNSNLNWQWINYAKNSTEIAQKLY
ncbi:hypothetical protein HZS_1240 [Henneguya salminicola]|nr:hypothetical protein HZS_1240 [Henneguya salminicola]